MLAGVEGVLVVEALSSSGLPGRLAEVASVPLFIPPVPRPIKLVRPGRPLSLVPVVQPLMGELPLEVVQTWSELEAQYSTGLLAGESGLFPAMEASVVSGAPVPDEAFSDLDVPEGNQGQASPLAEQLMELSLSSCPDNGSEDSEEEEGMSRRHFLAL